MVFSRDLLNHWLVKISESGKLKRIINKYEKVNSTFKHGKSAKLQNKSITMTITTINYVNKNNNFRAIECAMWEKVNNNDNEAHNNNNNNNENMIMVIRIKI